MTTPRTRPLVSLFVTVIMTLGACVSHPALDGPAPVEIRPFVINFHNDAREYVHVYLIDERREWLLGRVEPGAVASLRIPEAPLAGSVGFMQLAVIPGERLTLRAALDRRGSSRRCSSRTRLVGRERMPTFGFSKPHCR